MPASAKHAVRWVRRKLGRLVRPAPAPYRPDFSGTDMLRTLLGTTDDSRIHEPEARHLALKTAREQFGSRFFVTPATIPSLWRRIKDHYPDWYQGQIETTEADADQGLPIYNLKGSRLGADFPWNRLPSGPGADGMYAKRPHRFAFAPRNALACLYDPGAARRLSGMLEAWMHCATRGASRFCYDSNLGVIQRILALSWCWAFLAARDPGSGIERGDPECRVLAIIRADIGFLEPRLGQSAPNNHLLADWFAGWYLQQVFPEFLAQPEVDYESRWRDELLRQTYPDGGSFEHSAHYHEFACEMGSAYLLLCRRGVKMPNPEVNERVEALLRFQAALTGPEAVPLAIGNGIEDTLFPLDPGEGWCPGSLRELYRALFRPEVSPSSLDNISVVRAFWLLAGELAPPPSSSPTADTGIVSFPDSGLYIQNDPELNACLSFRTGPRSGLPVAAGHMHADFLSIYFSVARRAILVDAGTYTYRSPSERWQSGSPAWRPYFAGPAAHNTLAIDGHDPLGELRGDFRKFDTEACVTCNHRSTALLDLVETRLRGAGAYEGFQRTCVHVRGVYWLILDHSPPDALQAGTACYGFQFAPGSEVSVDGRRVTIGCSADASALTLLASTGLDEPTKLEGSLEPLGGWVSPHYGELIPAPQLRFGIQPGGGSSAFLLGIGGISVESLEVAEPEEGVTIIRVQSAEYEDILLWNGAAGADRPIEYDDMYFEGLLLWIRVIGGRPTILRCLDGGLFSWDKYQLDLEIKHDEVKVT